MISRPLTSSSALLRVLLLLLLLLLSTGASTATRKSRRSARRSPDARKHHPPPPPPPPPHRPPSPPPPPPKISWATNITLLGDASFKNNSISLTSGTPGSVGRALRPVRFRHPTTGNPASFSTSFSFSITPTSPPSFGDGLAFLITSAPKSLGSPDGYMGLFPNNSATSHPAQLKNRLRSGDRAATVAVEFDTNHDSALRDYNDNHVALDVNRMVSTAYASGWDSMVDLKGGAPMTAWVEYNSSESKLQAWLSYSRDRPPHPLLVANVDLSVHFREFMHVGFSASDRWDGAALHLVTGWSFRTVGFSTPSLACQTCSSNQDDEDAVDQQRSGAAAKGSRPAVYIMGGDLEVSEPPSADVSGAAARPNKQRRRNLVVGLGVAGAFVALFLVMSRMAANSHLNRSRREGSSGRAPQPAIGGPMRDAPARISLDELRSATKEFDCSKIIGRGSYGTVYEGLLPSGCKVAVKRFDRIEGFSKIFEKELTAVLCSSRHRNLVPLKAWCCEKEELLLVYEYMPNGSLDKVLHPPPSPPTAAAVILPWDKRSRIVVGVATALAFLHDECEKRIIHRDVKACRVLLDEDFNARLGGLGRAEFNEDNRTPQVNHPADIMGYLAPEYVHSGVATDKSDAYSFGVLALEVASGRLPLDKGAVLVDWVWGLWGRGRLVKAADPRLGGEFKRDEMARMLRVGLSCAHPDCRQRPTMRKAIRMLNGEMPLPLLPARKPAIRLLFPMPEASQDTTDAVSSQSSGDTTTQYWSTPCTSFS